MRRTSVVVAVAAALMVVLWIPSAPASASPVAAQAPICSNPTGDYPPNPQGCLPAGTPAARPSAASGNRAAAGALARTGSDHLFDVLRVAALAVGVGALALYLRRHAEHGTARALS